MIKGWMCALVMALLSMGAAVAEAPIRALQPPFHRAWDYSYEAEAWSVRSVLAGDVICFASSDSYGALDISTGKTAWNNHFFKGHRAVVLASSDDVVYIATEGFVFACSAKTGERLWITPIKGTPGAISASGKMIYVVTDPGVLTAIDIATRQVRWTLRLSDKLILASSFGCLRAAAVLLLAGDRLFVDVSAGDVCCVDAKSGFVRWRKQLKWPEENRGYDYLALDGNRLYVSSEIGRVAALDIANGVKKWEYDAGRLIDHRLAILGDKLLFRAGDEVRALNSDGAVAWTQPMRKTDFGRSPLVVDGDIAVQVTEPYIEAFDEDGKMVWSYDVSRDCRMEGLFGQITSAHLMRDGLIVGAGRAYRRYSLGKCEPPEPDVARLLPMVEAAAGDVQKLWSSEIEEARQELQRSKDPRVMAFYRQQLSDPRAPRVLRTEASYYLGRKGGEAEIDLVVSMRNTCRTVDPIEKVFDDCLFTPEQTGKYHHSIPTKLIATKKDSKGVTWGLLTSPILGHYADMWIARYQGDGHWTEWTFTGEYSEYPDTVDWFGRFVGNGDLRKDSDGDGWSDLVEERIGTDRNKSDTDRDGLKDSEDKNPLTGPRQLGEVEEVLMAAFAGDLLFSKSTQPLLVKFPKGVEPFELMESGWVIVPKVEGNKEHLASVVDNGVGVVSFSPPGQDFAGMPVDARNLDCPVVFNFDHTEAMLNFGIYDGPLSGYWHDLRLRKVCGHWVVVEVGVTIVS